MKNKIFSLKNLIWFCAIGLATFSGYYSVFGISKLFSGGAWTVVGMAAMLEFSKLVVITFLHDHFKDLKTSFKVYLTAAASVLMIITSIGVYGYLTNSYQETAKHIYEAQNKIALLDQKKTIFTEQRNKLDTLIKQKTERINSYDKLRLSQENVLNNQITQKGSTRGLQKNIQSVDKSTQTLNDEITELSKKSLTLTDSVTLIEQEKLNISNTTFTSELGPLLYLSRITGLSMDLVVNWFIIVLVIVFDPLAVSLVIAANHLKNIEKENMKDDEDVNKTLPKQTKNKRKLTPEVTPQVSNEVITQVTPQVTPTVQETVENESTEEEDSFLKKIQESTKKLYRDKQKLKNRFLPREKKVEENAKKDLEITQKNVILKELPNETENEVKEKKVEEPNLKENFYGEIVKPGFEYRRGVKIK